MKNIEIIPTAGLCNRMRALASGVFLAHKLHLPAKIYWNNTIGLKADFCQLFQPINLTDVELIENNRWVYQIEFTKDYLLRWPILNLVYKVIYNHSIYTNGDIINKISRQEHRNLLLISCCPMCQCYNMNELFVPLPDIQERINHITSLFGEKTIGIHIRRTDNKQSIRLSPDNAFEERIANEITKDPKVKFYLASDDENIKKQIIEKFDAPDRFIFIQEKTERNSLAGMKTAVVELFCLSKTKKIIGSNYSSYSNIAAELGDIPIEYA